MLQDTVLTEAIRAGSCGLFVGLPRATWTQGHSWRRDLVHRAYCLVDDIAVGGVPGPRCVAEQVALDLELGRARRYAELLLSSGLAFDELPAHPQDG
ncbi:hypothetical protein [Streptomyces anulatus]|uniref:hypothetical protein n=1 Tax=Streptomyces anulatus TaxID=1892 RepID=UPI002F917ABA